MPPTIPHEKTIEGSTVLKANENYKICALTVLAALMLAACNRDPAKATVQTKQPDTVVTSRSNGKAVPNPRRGSYKKSDPNAPAGYRTPD